MNESVLLSATVLTLPDASLFALESLVMGLMPHQHCVILDLRAVDELQSVLWLRRIRALLQQHNKVLLGIHRPGKQLELVKAAAIPVLDERYWGSQDLSLPEKAPTEMPIIKPSTMLHEGHVRGGQSFQHLEGDVWILGNIHAGAEVIAGGHIVVLGMLRGKALAGVEQDNAMILTLGVLEAELLAIGQACLASDEIAKTDYPSLVRHHNGQWIIRQAV